MNMRCVQVVQSRFDVVRLRLKLWKDQVSNRGSFIILVFTSVNVSNKKLVVGHASRVRTRISAVTVTPVIACKLRTVQIQLVRQL